MAGSDLSPGGLAAANCSSVRYKALLVESTHALPPSARARPWRRPGLTSCSAVTEAGHRAVAPPPAVVRGRGAAERVVPVLPVESGARAGAVDDAAPPPVAVV